MSLPPPLALTPCLPAELLSYILEQAHPTVLIICGTRTAFLSSLLEATSIPPPQPPTPQDPDPDVDPESSQPPPPSHSPPNPEEDEPSSPPPQPQQPPPRHPLLTPTLHQISISRHTTTAFIPTVSHLRAYLSVFSGPPMHKHTPTDRDNSGTYSTYPLLVLYGLVELHRETSEWSTQGLGNTCAALVEAGRRSRRRVVLVEERRVGADEQRAGEDGGEDGEEAGDNGNEDGSEMNLGIGRDVRESGGNGIWHEKLPILSGSVKRAGAEAEYGGRTVEVVMVLRRWFKFARGQWENGGQV